MLALNLLELCEYRTTVSVNTFPRVITNLTRNQQHTYKVQNTFTCPPLLKHFEARFGTTPLSRQQNENQGFLVCLL